MADEDKNRPTQVAGFDPFVSVPIPRKSSICEREPSDPGVLAWVYRYASWPLLFPDGCDAPPSVPMASEIHVQLLGRAVMNADTSATRMQIAALMELLHVAPGATVSRRTRSSSEIHGFRVSNILVDGGDLGDCTLKLPSLKNAFSKNGNKRRGSIETESGEANGEASRNGSTLALVSTSTRVVIVPTVEGAAAGPEGAFGFLRRSSGQQNLFFDSRLTRRRMNVGGLKSASDALIEMVELPLRFPDGFDHFGIACPRSILLHGPPGTGKTLLVREIARAFQVPLFQLSARHLYGSSEHDPKRQLEAFFDKVKKFQRNRSNRKCDAAGAIVFIDEIDSICPKCSTRGAERSGDGGLIAQLLTSLETVKAVVVAATNRPNALDPALRRPNRFDREVVVDLPNCEERLDILSVCMRQVLQNPPSKERLHSDWKSVLESVARRTPGWSGADLSRLVREAVVNAICDARGKGGSAEPSFDREKGTFGQNDNFNLDPLDLDFDRLLDTVQPASHNAWATKVQEADWSDIGGMEKVQQALKTAVEWPFLHADAFRRLGVSVPRGILLHGPPGCAKTTLVRIIASRCNATFFGLSCAQICSRYLGESERKIRTLFEQAKLTRPSIIFFDEIDAIASKRDNEYTRTCGTPEHILHQLLAEMDGICSSTASSADDSVLVVGATNRLDRLDPAILRPGRFDKIIEVKLPDFGTRKEIFKVHMRRLPVDESDPISLDYLASKTDGFNGADIAGICKEAAFFALRENINSSHVSKNHFLQALKQTGKLSTSDAYSGV
ncbi:uncharacterized protein LOC126315411 [Schistocerca gregaria]|uniref:uncharacterized protein LOC126315411 n=1 Tax=Schistocerca gregaria TaxID=7010 RepID=UPI00211EC958|nr:uncharacterized protein LOC126315411 [Schistocerca gregaria]